MGNAQTKDGGEKRRRRGSSAEKASVSGSAGPRGAEDIPLCFSKQEIKHINNFVQRLEREKARKDEDDYFQLSDVDKVPALAFNPMAARIAEIVYEETRGDKAQRSEGKSADGLRENEVDLDLFLRILAIFHSKTSDTVKQQYAFKALDSDEDGLISRQDFVYALSCIFPGLPMAELEVQTDFVFDAVKLSADEALTPEHFAQLFDYTGFSRIFTVAM